MSDDEKFINNKTIIKIIGGINFSKLGKIIIVVILVGSLLGLISIGLHSYQKTCSDFPCPGGYIKDESKKDIECDSLTCNESDDKNTCCNKSIDCVGSWSDFSECSESCGPGTQNRTYNITTPAQNNGSSCAEQVDSVQSQDCNIRACSTCSDYMCPGNYTGKTGVDNISCGKMLCDLDNRDTCCEEIQEIQSCDNIIRRGYVPTPNASISQYLYNTTIDQCKVYCSTNDDCKSFSYNTDRTRCQIYSIENISELQENTNYNYYPEKCQP
jgi:hypothetical protein